MPLPYPITALSSQMNELIQLSQNDPEILAVLAHEQGHLVHRHSLQQALNSLGMSLLIISITGDTSDLLVTLPGLLVSARYSQDFEMEADNFAIQALKKLGLSPLHLADFFEKMETGHDHPGWSMISSHPDTQKRIDNAKDQAQ